MEPSPPDDGGPLQRQSLLGPRENGGGDADRHTSAKERGSPGQNDDTGMIPEPHQVDLQTYEKKDNRIGDEGDVLPKRHQGDTGRG